jgi:pilus assembly protein Flp/PilA
MTGAEPVDEHGVRGRQRLRALPITFRSWLPEADRGATATEYAILVGLIAVAIVFGVTAFGTNLSSFYDYITNGIEAAL